MLTADEYRIQAAKARRLTSGIGDAALIVTLLKYAAECDEAADEADVRADVTRREA